MPSGAAMLAAATAAIAAGLTDGVLRDLGLRRGAAAAWALLALAASGVNLGVPPTRPALLINPGGCAVPVAFALLLITAARGGRARAAAAAAGAGVVLALVLAWAEQSGAGWPATLAAGCGAAAVAAALGRSPRAALAGAAGALAVAAALRGAAGLAGLAPWPAALGGGQSFDAGMLAALAAPGLGRLRAAWRWAGAQHLALRPTAR